MRIDRNGDKYSNTNGIIILIIFIILFFIWFTSCVPPPSKRDVYVIETGTCPVYPDAKHRRIYGRNFHPENCNHPSQYYLR